MGKAMIIKMRSGNTEEVYDFVGRDMIARGIAEEVKIDDSTDALKAEEQGGPAATIGIEMATLEPKQENAVVRFVRTARSCVCNGFSF